MARSSSGSGRDPGGRRRYQGWARPSKELVELTPTALAPNGSAVARDAGGRVVLIEGAVPDDRVLAKITADRRSLQRAHVVRLLDPSPARGRPDCAEVSRGCGGCQWQGIDLGVQREWKRKMVIDSVRRYGGFEPPTPGLPILLAPWQFRTTIRAAVTNGRAGLRRTRSKVLVPVDGCLVAHPALEELLVDSRYPDASKVLLRCGARTGERLAATTPRGIPRTVPDDVRSDHVHELAAGRRWRVSADSFFQSRPDGVDAMATLVASAADELGGATSAVDLFSGVGIFSGVLAARGWSVVAVESSPTAVADARANLGDLPVSLVTGNVMHWQAHRADLVVADPSREGLTPRGVGVVVATGARRVVLISCDATSLGHDAGLLRRSGYRMTSLTEVDLFPHTSHVEVVTVHDR